MLKNERGRYLQSHELMPILGFKPGGHLPKEGFPPRRVEHNGQSAMFVCYAASGKGNRSPHRLKVMCEVCAKYIPFGRFGQHIPACINKMEEAIWRMS